MTVFTHPPRVSLARFTFCWWRHNRLLMTAQWPDNCDVGTWKVISNSLDIDFSRGKIYGRSCKKAIHMHGKVERFTDFQFALNILKPGTLSLTVFNFRATSTTKTPPQPNGCRGLNICSCVTVTKQTFAICTPTSQYLVGTKKYRHKR